MAEIPQNSFQGPLAPKIGLNESYKNPIPGGPKNETNGRNYRKYFIPLGAITVALLILPLTINQLNQNQDIRQRASEPSPTISISKTPTPSKAGSVTPVLPPPAVFDASTSGKTQIGN